MLQFRDMSTVQCYLYSYLQLQIGQSDWDTYQLKEKNDLLHPTTQEL